MSGKFPLRLKSYFAIKQDLTAVPEHKEEEPQSIAHAISASVSRSGESNNYFVFVNVAVNEPESENLSYIYDLRLFGSFGVEESFDELPAIKLVKDLGIPLLIGAAREKIVAQTSIGPWDPIYLDFIPLSDVQMDSESVE